ncbi:MAG: alanine racemase [Candidatus Taylorbacteria bacterium]|nr:alanine racemase [Candidatus Taylorbacteria bacterium]
MKNQPLRTWVEIDYAAIEGNARALRKILGEEASMMAVVKSNAYGHGMADAARAAIRGGAERLAVDELSEALALRATGIKAPILVLGYTLPELYKAAAQKNISITISSLESLQGLAKMKLPKRLNIHLKFDTGLYRQGIQETYIEQSLRILSAKGFPAAVEGAYTHFAVMEDPLREEYSKMQARAFRNAVAKLKAKGFSPLTHASASSGILYSKDYHFDMSRAGIALYGLWPSPEIRKWTGHADLVPALSWKSIVTEVKLAPKGSKVGYDLTHETLRNSRLAIVPVGYWHGLPRSLSNKGQVLVCGKRANIVGRISMDMAIIDVTDIPSVREGDEVVIIGRQGKETMPAEEVAASAGTINYEIVTRINPLIPRIPVGSKIYSQKSKRPAVRQYHI